MEHGAVQDISGAAAAPALVRAVRELPLVQIAWFSLLILALFLPVLKPMVTEWLDDENMGHAFFVPIVAGYVIWNERERILDAPVKPFWGGIAVVLWGCFQMVLGFLGADFFVARTALLVTIVGVIWTLCGTAVLRRLAFPLLLLAFTIRLPLFLHQQLTFPLQLLASTIAGEILSLIGIPVWRNGNILELPSHPLAVVEACSGIRSILSLTFLSLAYAYFFDKRKWMRPVLFVLSIPIAMMANSIRIVITGVLSEYKKEWAEGNIHAAEGWVLFMTALMMLIGAHRLICRLTRPRSG